MGRSLGVVIAGSPLYPISAGAPFSTHKSLRRECECWNSFIFSLEAKGEVRQCFRVTQDEQQTERLKSCSHSFEATLV